MENQNNETLIRPDRLFEVSWEVCNKVGGIHTVVATKAQTMVEALGNRYITIGPDIHRENDNTEFEEDTGLLAEWKQMVYSEGIRIRIGRWNVNGRPITILVDFRNGVTIELEGNIYQIIEFQHVKPGKGAAFVRTKLKNIVSGGVVEKTFRPTEKFENAHIERKEMQYLYQDGDLYYFMDMETYEQQPIDSSKLGPAFQFVKENTMCTLVSYKGSVFSVEAPNFMELEVTATEPGVRGDTATNVTKPATLETGAIIKVPLFINEGEKIQVDTRTGEYLGRVKE